MISIEYLHERLDYNPVSGILTWKKHSDLGQRSDLIGKEAGHVDKTTGYRVVRVRKQKYMSHRLIWAMQTGKWPREEIDHKNMIKSDNSWANLREANRQINTINRGNFKHNTSGFKGVSYHKQYGKWHAYINENGKLKTIGFYDNLDEAAKARKVAESKIYEPIIEDI